MEGYLLGALIGTAGATVANITGIGGGVVFFPYLLAHSGNAETALINAVYIQIVGMGTGSFLWYLREGINPQFGVDLFKVVLLGFLGMQLGKHYLSLSPGTLLMVFSFFVIVLSSISLIVSVRDVSRDKPCTRHRLRLTENLSLFGSGFITSQISFGFGECVMLVRYLYDGNFRYAVRLAVTSSTVLLILFALLSPLKPQPSLVMPIALGTIAGAGIGFYFASHVRLQRVVKNTVFSLLIGMGIFGLITPHT